MSSSAPNKPSELEAQYHGEVRAADGYQYWTTSEEDEDTVDFADMAKRAEMVAADEEKAKKTQKKRNATGRLRRWLVRLMSLLLVLVVAALIFMGVSYWQVRGGADEVATEDAGAVIVLGAAQFNCVPTPVFQERLDHAFTLWEAERAPVIFTTGSKQDGDECTEGQAGFQYLRERGVPERSIVNIVDGQNTYEQLLASANQLNEREIETALLVSDPYHSYRLLDIADEVGITAYVAPTTLDAKIENYAREAAAVSLGRVLGYRRLASLTD